MCLARSVSQVQFSVLVSAVFKCKVRYIYTQQNNLRVTKCKFSYVQILIGSMGKTTEDIEILLIVS